MSKSFFIAGKSFTRWFPPHMRKGLVKMRESLRRVDCLIEVHDARIPLSGRNSDLTEYLSAKPRVVLLNKTDLVQMTEYEVETIFQHYQKEGVKQVMFTKCNSTKFRKPVHKSVKKVIPACVEMVRWSERYEREVENDINIMVVGIPNVGKSSLLNDLRQNFLGLKPTASVSKEPGHTKTVGFRTKVCNDPDVYLLDTPGIFSAKVGSMEEGLKLAVCNTIHNHLVGPPMVAEYLLHLLNENMKQEYVRYYDLEQPTYSIKTLLNHIAETRQLVQQQTVYTGTGKMSATVPNYIQAALNFLNAYRAGLIGKFVLDKL